MEIKNNIRGKKVLLVGLGILGGGVATAKWLLDQGAILTITDLKDEKYLQKSIKKLTAKSQKLFHFAKATRNKKARFVLGKHDENDFKNSDLIVLNPDVPVDSPFVKIAKENKIPITNELNLFVENVKSKNIVAITGTRGKTTTTQWTAFLMDKILGRTFLVGNSPETPFLGMIDKIKENDFVVMEVPSYHLEIVNKNFRPKVAVITNIYIDHIARHNTESNYANIKSNIFKYQKEDDYLILNKENKWTKEFLKKDLKQKVILFPDNKILPELPKYFGEHNKQNLTIALLVLKIFEADISKVKIFLKDLPQPKFRQEKIYEDKNLKVINDSAATSPEATIAAVNRFEGDNLVLITGGTDKGLEYGELGKFLSKKIKPENLILLGGSATEKLKVHLAFKTLNEFETLEECLLYIKSETRNPKSEIRKTKQKVLVFSPGAKSFEKFKNEFDRGEKFNKLFKKIFYK